MRCLPVLVPYSSVFSLTLRGWASSICVRNVWVPTLVSYALATPNVWICCTGMFALSKNSGVNVWDDVGEKPWRLSSQ